MMTKLNKKLFKLNISLGMNMNIQLHLAICKKGVKRSLQLTIEWTSNIVASSDCAQVKVDREKGCWLFVIKGRKVKERGRLRDRAFWKKRKRCKRVKERWKRRHRKDKILVLLKQLSTYTFPHTHLTTVFLHRRARDIPAVKHTGIHAMQEPQSPIMHIQPRHTYSPPLKCKK